jgi:hypothetical protein
MNEKDGFNDFIADFGLGAGGVPLVASPSPLSSPRLSSPLSIKMRRRLKLQPSFSGPASGHEKEENKMKKIIGLVGWLFLTLTVALTVVSSPLPAALSFVHSAGNAKFDISTGSPC